MGVPVEINPNYQKNVGYQYRNPFYNHYIREPMKTPIEPMFWWLQKSILIGHIFLPMIWHKKTAWNPSHDIPHLRGDEAAARAAASPAPIVADGQVEANLAQQVGLIWFHMVSYRENHGRTMGYAWDHHGMIMGWDNPLVIEHDENHQV